VKNLIFAFVILTLSISAQSKNIELLCEYENVYGRQEAFLLKMDTTASTAHIGLGKGVEATLQTSEKYYTAEGRHSGTDISIKVVVNRRTAGFGLITNSAGRTNLSEGTCKRFEGNVF
jgi:hypothetical protein